jgi:hypothetical protein
LRYTCAKEHFGAFGAFGVIPCIDCGVVLSFGFCASLPSTLKRTGKPSLEETSLVARPFSRSQWSGPPKNGLECEMEPLASQLSGHTTRNTGTVVLATVGLALASQNKIFFFVRESCFFSLASFTPD